MHLPENLSPITKDAIEIWQAGVDAVRADRLFEREVRSDGYILCVQDRDWQLDPRGRLIIVGAGKATFKMAQGLITSLEGLDPSIDRIGWINVPEGTVDGPLDSRIHVCQARPMGANEPTPLVISGTRKIIELLATAKQNDTVLCLLSGGGSALLCAPIDGVTLEDKLAVTRLLSGRGATIEELNLVRSSLSRVKHGGLARLSRAGQIISLMLSDVLGDPLATIASGPTFIDSPIDSKLAASTLMKFDRDLRHHGVLVKAMIKHAELNRFDHPSPKSIMPDVANIVLANNATAVDAAGTEAVRRGYAYYMESSPRSEGAAEELGRALGRQCLGLSQHSDIQCLITGGEPSVVLPSAAIRGRGGRNQHLVLAAFDELKKQGVHAEKLAKMALLSGGTDGEDGPTNAAGAWLDAAVQETANALGLDAGDYLRRCDAYTFFDQTCSLLKTGPTHTNVCDIRVAIFDSRNSP